MFRSQETIELFYIFIAELKIAILKAKQSKTLDFINFIAKNKQLLRFYTQNIDCLEEMYSELSLSDFVIQLHGDLNTLKCVLCFKTFIFNR